MYTVYTHLRPELDKYHVVIGRKVPYYLHILYALTAKSIMVIDLIRKLCCSEGQYSGNRSGHGINVSIRVSNLERSSKCSSRGYLCSLRHTQAKGFRLRVLFHQALQMSQKISNDFQFLYIRLGNIK